MMKAAVSLLAVSALMVAPGIISGYGVASAQAAAAGQVQMDPAEYADYDAAMNKLAANPQAQAPALEAYLVKWPKSAVKADVLLRIMGDYQSFADGHVKAIGAADNVLQLTPNQPQALYVEAYDRNEQALTLTDAAAKQAGLDAAASFAQKGLDAPKAAAMTDDQYAQFMGAVKPTYYSIIGVAAFQKKDYASAITAFKGELTATPIAATQTPGTALQDTFYLGQSYQQSNPPDLVSCTFYTTRAASFAPDNFKAIFQPLATYCYKKYHGGADGYDAVVTAAKANLFVPAGFTIVPAPTAADQVKALLASTPESDLPKLAPGDKLYVIGNGTPEQADKVFLPIKGKTVEFPGVTVVGGTADAVQVAISDDAVASKTAEYTFNMKTPLKAAPVAGAKITLAGTYASYVQSPAMIVMSDGEEVATKKVAPKTPVRRR